MAERSLSNPYINRSESIYSGLHNIIQQYPNILRILNHNRRGTIDLIKATDLVVALKLDFDINIQHEESFSYATYTRDKFMDKINAEIDRYCQNLQTAESIPLREELWDARKALTKHIREQYNEKAEEILIPFRQYELNIELYISGHYACGKTYVAWSCIGFVKVTERWDVYTFKIKFNGQPDIKVMLIDCEELKKLEDVLSKKSVEEQLGLVDGIERKNNPKVLTWENLLKLT